jgi:hypothetical protein
VSVGACAFIFVCDLPLYVAAGCLGDLLFLFAACVRDSSCAHRLSMSAVEQPGMLCCPLVSCAASMHHVGESRDTMMIHQFCFRRNSEDKTKYQKIPLIISIPFFVVVGSWRLAAHIFLIHPVVCFCPLFVFPTSHAASQMTREQAWLEESNASVNQKEEVKHLSCALLPSSKV